MIGGSRCEHHRDGGGCQVMASVSQAPGWYAEHRYGDQALRFPLVGWGTMCNGTVVALELTSEGDVKKVDPSVRVVHDDTPSESLLLEASFTSETASP